MGRTLSGLLGAAALVWAAEAHAGGFYINEQTAKGLGRGFAGEAALGGDAAALWSNPALSVFQDRLTVTGALSGISIGADLENEGSTIASPATLGLPVPLTGGDGGTPVDTAAVPLLAVLAPKGRWRFGFSLNAPFGLVSAYDEGWFGRYDSTRTELLTLNAQVSVAYEVSDKLAVAVGANGQYAQAVLESDVPGVLPGAPDGRLLVDGDDISPGWNVGAVYRPRPNLRIGAHYRSTMHHKLDGRARLLGLSGPLGAANFDAPGVAALNLPGIGTLGVAYDVTDKLTLLTQGTYFNWSVFSDIRVLPEGRPDLLTELRYKDTINAHAGAEYRLDDRWTFRAGFMFDPTPTRENFRTTRVPDANRYWGTLGATWRPIERASIDAGLAFVSIAKSPIDRTDVFFEGTPLQTVQDLRSTIDGNAVIASLGGSFEF